MESLILSNAEETVRIWCDAEQLADIVKLKVAWIVCDVILMEGEVAYEANIGDLFLIH